MVIKRVEKCPRCGQKTLGVSAELGTKFFGESKVCSNCGYRKPLPGEGKSFPELLGCEKRTNKKGSGAEGLT